MAKYKRVSRRILNQKAGSITVARLGLDCTTDAEMKRFDKEPVKIPEETGPTLQEPVEKVNVKKKKSGLTKVGVGLGVMVPFILLVVYHYDELTVTFNSYF